MKKKLSLLMLALLALTAVAATLARRAVSELSVVSEATVWNFADVTLGASYTSDFKLEGDAKNVENIYANFEDVTYASTFKADALAFTGEYPIRSNSKKFAQSGTLHFKTSVAGKIVVKFNDTGSSASATAVKRYLVVNGTQTEYWTSRENNGTEDPYAAQLNVTTGEIEVPAGDVTIAGSSAICVSYIKFTPNSTEPESNANQSYTLTFKDAGTDSDSPSDLSSEGSIDVSSILGADEAAYVSSVTNATKVYLGRTGHGLKLGTGSVTGTFTLNLATPVKPTSIVVKARKYNNNQNTIKINGNDFTLNDETSDDCTVQYDGNTEVSSIAIEAGNLRAYVLSVTVNYQEAGGEEPQPVADIIYDFAAEQALIAAGTVEKPGNFNGNQNNGQGFNAYSVKIRNDYKGYVKKEGSTLPETCNIWRRSDRFDQDASWNVAGGVNMPNNREFVIDGLTPGSKVVIEYDATNAAEGSKNIIWAVGENNKLGEAVGAGEGIPVTTATIGGVEAVPGETAIASGAEILIKSVTPAVKGTGYMVIQVKKNMLISKISILVNEDAVSNAVTVADGIENGTVKVNRTTAYEGDDVYVTATPAEGYELEAITVKDADGADVTVTDGKFTMPAKAVTVSATFKDKRIVYDFAAEQALIAAGTVEKPGNFNGNQNNGQGFNAYSVKIRNDYKGYVKKEGSTLPETCNIWRRSDRFDQDASWNVAGGVNMPNNREFVIDGLTPGSKVVIEYDATNAAEGSKNIIWAVGENNKLGEAVGAGEGIPVTTATIGGVEAVPGETAIASGAEILIKSVTPAVKGTGYMVIQVKKNMLISKISILVNEDAVSNAVTVADGIENGTVKVNRTTAYEGDDVYVTATPAEGYELEAITVKDADGADVTVTDGKFTMPAKAVTVTVTFKQAGITLWSSETAVEANWGSNISIDKEKFANAKVGDIVHVAVEGVAAGSAWNAQVVLKAGNYSDIEGGVPVGDGSVTDATFVLTGDMLQYVKTYGMFVAGAGFSSKLVTLEYADEVAGSENSIWVGNATASVTVHANHFKCANEFSGVKAGDIIRITSTGEPEWIILQYSGADTGWEWTLYDGAVFTKTETGYDVKVTESMVTQMNTDGIIINHADGITISQVELIAAPEAPKFYIIGLNGNWDRTNMIEMARNESGRYEYEFTTETQAFFAFADKQMTAEEAEADQDWSVFNSYRYSLGDGDVEYTQLGEIKSLVKGAANGTITLKPGTFKITVEPDFNAVTITGEFAPEPQPVTVDKLFIMGTGTPGEWNTTTEMTYNETAQAFEYTLEVPAGGAWFTFSDAEFDGNWDDFNANHRYALGAGDVDATIGETLPLVKVNGTLAIKTAGTYKISVAKDLSTVTITATGTGINGIAADKMKNAIIYTVSGQRVEKAQKGLYIIDGKKVVVK